MGNTGYIALSRQTGLLKEMQLVANNIANISTTGFRKEGVVFAEYVQALDNGNPSISMAYANARATYQNQGSVTQTGNPFDMAIEGDGFFLVQTPQGQMLTRAGSFTPNADGELVTPDGYRLLDNGSAPIFVPPDAQSMAISSDGTLSADGRPLAQVGIYAPTNPSELAHRNGVLFAAPSGVQPVEDSKILQGFLEESNVNPIAEVARMIEVQRAYEFGQTLLNKEDERIRNVLQTLGK